MKNHWLEKKIDEETQFCRVYVNGRVYGRRPSTTLSYADIVAMAPSSTSKPLNPDLLYTVVYDHGPETKPSGILSPGQEVQVVDGLKINIAWTGNA